MRRCALNYLGKAGYSELRWENSLASSFGWWLFAARLTRTPNPPPCSWGWPESVSRLIITQVNWDKHTNGELFKTALEIEISLMKLFYYLIRQWNFALIYMKYTWMHWAPLKWEHILLFKRVWSLRFFLFERHEIVYLERITRAQLGKFCPF